MSMKLQKLKIEKQKLNDEYIITKEKYELVKDAHAKI